MKPAESGETSIMSTIKTEQQPWNTSQYMRIIDASYRQGQLIVLFADQTRAVLDVGTLAATMSNTLQWDALAFTDYEIMVPSEGEDVEITWLAIRAHSDPTFNAHLTEQARQEAVRIGRRLQHLRCQQRLPPAELAARAGIAPDALRAVEQGETTLDLTVLGAILSSLGSSFDDLLPSNGDAADDPAREDADHGDSDLTLAHADCGVERG